MAGIDLRSPAGSQNGASVAAPDIFYTAGAWPLRTTVTSDVTKPVVWWGPTAPPVGGGYAQTVDYWMNSGAI